MAAASGVQPTGRLDKGGEEVHDLLRGVMVIAHFGEAHRLQGRRKGNFEKGAGFSVSEFLALPLSLAER